MRGLLTQPLLAMIAVLLWLGAISLWSPTAPEVLLAPAAAGAPHAEHVADGNGYGPPIEEGLFAVLADEDEVGDELQVKAGLLTVLVLTVCVGPILWGLLASGRGRLRARICLPIQCCFHCVVCCRQGRHVATLLEVFRL